MNKKVVNTKYYIKKDGKVIEVDINQLKNFLETLKKEGKKYICPNCSVCDCEKIIYTDINKSKEVIIGTFERKDYKFFRNDKVIRTKDETFKVYECKRFEMFKEFDKQNGINLRKEIINIDKKILTLKHEIINQYDKEKNEELVRLQMNRREMIDKIDDPAVLEDLKIREDSLKRMYMRINERNKALKLENN